MMTLVLSIGLAAIVIILLNTPGVIHKSGIKILSYTYDLENLDGLCPGDVVVFHTTMDILRPGVFQAIVNIHDAEKHLNVGPSYVSEKKSQPYEREVSVDVPWEVPDLPPGDYERVVAIVALDAGSEPAFHSDKFSIREDCK